ncbi:uncharacterized protein [Parasteatoda tepidariorum]|uniref:uncharacterized protein n=1 Tax=Parasteatoda tepidariorum TaxID=114398 RepID=UPI00077FAC28|nr:uncharacterized protein LOC107440781 [Parasteatoda tepidariorum]
MCCLVVKYILLFFLIRASKSRPRKVFENSRYAPNSVVITPLSMENQNAPIQDETKSEIEKSFNKYEKLFTENSRENSAIHKSASDDNFRDTMMLSTGTKPLFNTKLKFAKQLDRHGLKFENDKLNFGRPINSPAMNRVHFLLMEKNRIHLWHPGIGKNGFQRTKFPLFKEQKINDRIMPKEFEHEIDTNFPSSTKTERMSSSTEATDDSGKEESTSKYVPDSLRGVDSKEHDRSKLLSTRLQILQIPVHVDNTNLFLLTNETKLFKAFNISMATLKTQSEDFSYLESPYSIGIICGLAFLILLLLFVVCLFKMDGKGTTPVKKDNSTSTTLPQAPGDILKSSTENVNTRQAKSSDYECDCGIDLEAPLGENLRDMLCEMDMLLFESSLNPDDKQCIDKLLKSNYENNPSGRLDF